MLSGFASESSQVTLLWSRIRAPVNLNDVGYCFQMCGTGWTLGWSFLHQLLDSSKLPNIRRLLCPQLPRWKPVFCQHTSYIKKIKSNLAFSEWFYEKCRISWITWQKNITEYHSWHFSWLHIGQTCDLWGKAPEVSSACSPHHFLNLTRDIVSL